MNTHHRPNLVHAVAARIHDDIAINVAALGMYGPCIIFVLGQVSDGRVSVHLGTGFASPAGKRLTQRGRINIAVISIPKTAHQVVG